MLKSKDLNDGWMHVKEYEKVQKRLFFVKVVSSILLFISHLKTFDYFRGTSEVVYIHPSSLGLVQYYLDLGFGVFCLHFLVRDFIVVAFTASSCCRFYLKFAR